jgi:hypothetical protein
MTNQLGKHAMLGAVAGATGTSLLRGIMAGSSRLAPETLPPMKQEPGEYMVEQVEKTLPKHVRTKIPEQAEVAAATSIAFGYRASLVCCTPRCGRGSVLLRQLEL